MNTDTIITIRYRWLDDNTEHEGDVVIGDGKATYDDDYPYDARIFFYFHDFNEFKNWNDQPGNEFIIL